MGLFNNFPYPDTHQLNLDWILSSVKELSTYVKERVDGIQKALTDAQAAATTAENSANSAQIAATTAEEIATELGDALGEILLDNAGAHNAMYRGKNLGTRVTTEQWAAIADGSFNDLYIGDYWVIGGVTWRIAAFDYYYNSGDTSCTTHHVVIVPDAPLYVYRINDSDITTGGYIGSKMYTEGLDDAKTTISFAFGPSHILSHRQFLVNAVTNGKPSGCSWYDSRVELMNEQNVYGCKIFGVSNEGSTIPFLYTIDKSQFPLFSHNPSMISNRQGFWLRDVVSASAFACVGSLGDSNYNDVSGEIGVRPSFSITST